MLYRSSYCYRSQGENVLSCMQYNLVYCRRTHTPSERRFWIFLQSHYYENWLSGNLLIRLCWLLLICKVYNPLTCQWTRVHVYVCTFKFVILSAYAIGQAVNCCTLLLSPVCGIILNIVFRAVKKKITKKLSNDLKSNSSDFFSLAEEIWSTFFS